MPRRSFRYDPISKEMVEIEPYAAGDVSGPYVGGDIPAFVSPLDGTVVEGRRAYYDHMKRHNVVPFEAGDEKRRPPPVDPTPRREAIWENVDRAMRNAKKYRR